MAEVAEERLSFEAATLPHLGLLFRLAMRLSGSQSAAEDLVQETYVKALRAFPRLKNHTNIRAWLCRILTNLYVDSRRRPVEVLSEADIEKFSLYQAIWDEDPLPYSDNLHGDFMAQFQDEDVRQALSMLPEHYRLPVILCYVEEFSYKELSQILKVPMGTVMSRLFRGRKLLEKALWECAKRRGYVKEWR